MRAHGILLLVVDLLLLGAGSVAHAQQAFPADPIPFTTDPIIYNTFMELESISLQELHTGTDVAGSAGDPVLSALPPENWCTVTAVEPDRMLVCGLQRQEGEYACFLANHITPNPSVALGDTLGAGDTLGTLDAHAHLHAEIFLSPDGWIEDEDLRNPERYAFQNASWMADSQVPVVDSLAIHSGSPDTLQIWVHDTTDESPDYFNGIYKLLLKVSDLPVDSVVLDRYLTQDGSYPPDASEIYYDTGTYPSGHNDPNVLNYKLIGEISSATWRVAWWDAAGNHGESDPVEPPAAPAGEMTLFVRDQRAHLTWRVDSMADLRFFDVWESSRERGGYARVNEEPIPAEAGRTDYAFVAELPEEGNRAWYRVTAEDAAGAAYLIAEGSCALSYPSTTTIRARPNPSGREFRIELAIARSGPGRVDVFTPAGRRVRTIDEGQLIRGAHAYAWDGRDERGRAVSPGVYFVCVRAGGELRTKKVTLLR